jgi:hypothetical protein
MADEVDAILDGVKLEFQAIIDGAEAKSAALRAELATAKAAADTASAVVRSLSNQIIELEGDEAKRARAVKRVVEDITAARDVAPGRLPTRRG